MSKTIAIDFDGTLCADKYPDIGEPFWGVIYSARKEQAAGAKLILWTCRTDKELQRAVEAAKGWGLTFDAINESIPEWRERYGNDPRKVGADEYWDDRAVRAPFGTLVLIQCSKCGRYFDRELVNVGCPYCIEREEAYNVY